MKDLILVLNLGLKSIRSIIFNESGEIVSSASLPLTTYISGSRVEQDPLEWLSKGTQVIHESTIDRQIRDRVRYITVSSSASCLVPVTAEGEPLCRSIMVSDTRAAAQCERLCALPMMAQISERTGVRPHPSQPLEKILWLKENDLEIFTKTHKFLTPNDFLAFHLTGEFLTDLYNAEKYYFDVRTRTYPSELYDVVGVPVSLLPTVIQPATCVGKLVGPAADSLQLPKDCEFVTSTYDAICAFWGSGPADEGEVCDVSGTVTSLRVLSREQSRARSRDIFSTPALTGDYNIVGGSNNLGGGLIEWTKQSLYADEIHPYEVMENEAREVALGARGLVFLPYLMGERAPLWDDEVRGVFFGLERVHKRKEMARAIFESIGFSTMTLMQAIEGAGYRVDRIKASGGLARINLVSQVKADVLGKEVHIVDNFETTSLGAFLFVKLGAGMETNLLAGSRKIEAVREVIKPNQARHERYQSIYGLYKDLYQSLKPVFKKRKSVFSEIGFERIESIENL